MPALTATRSQVLKSKFSQHWFATTIAVIASLIVAFAVYSIATSKNVEWNVISEYLFSGKILDGVKVTLELTVITMICGTVLGIVLASMKISNSVILRNLSGSYIWFFRGTPVLVQIIFWFNIALFVPAIKIGSFYISTNEVISPYTAALLAFTLNIAAYMAETIRSGILAVDRGQTEAALALGLTPRLSLMRVVLPQSVRIILPQAGNLSIDLLKSTSLVAVIGTGDILTMAQSIYAGNYRVIELLFVASIWYLFITTIATFILGALERRLSRSVTRRKTKNVNATVHAIEHSANETLSVAKI